MSNRKIVKDEQMWASSTLEVSDLRKYINSSLEELEHDSNETSTSNFTITGNKTAPHDGRLGNTAGSWCASVDPLDDNGHHLIVDLGMEKFRILVLLQLTVFASLGHFIDPILFTIASETF